MEFKTKFTGNFKKKYKKLPSDIQKKFDGQFLKMSRDLHHPSLRLKKIKSAPGIWEGRVDLSYRFTFEIIDRCYIFRNIDHHDQCLNNP